MRLVAEGYAGVNTACRESKRPNSVPPVRASSTNSSIGNLFLWQSISVLAHVDFLRSPKLRCLVVPKPRRTFRLPHPQPLDALSFARFSGVPTFMRLPHIPQPEELEVAIIGVPFDGGTTYRPGPRFGPRHVRVQSAIIRPWNPVLHVNPFAKHRVADFGDLSVNPLSIEDTFARIEQGIAPLLQAGVRCVC